MRSSINKHRDMARSILPSRARGIPARLAMARRSARRDITGKLTYLARHHSPDGWDDWDEDSDLRAYPNIEIRQLVYQRRGADKLNHFERWAVAVTKHLPIEDRLSHMRAILPARLIGDHAMSHLRWRPELNPHPRYFGYFSIVAGRAREARAAEARAEHERLRKMVLTLLETSGGHRALNAAIKARTNEGERPPILAGARDVDDFLAYALAAEHGRVVDPRWRNALQETAIAFGLTRVQRATMSEWANISPSIWPTGTAACRIT